VVLDPCRPVGRHCPQFFAVAGGAQDDFGISRGQVDEHLVDGSPLAMATRRAEEPVGGQDAFFGRELPGTFRFSASISTIITTATTAKAGSPRTLRRGPANPRIIHTQMQLPFGIG